MNHENQIWSSCSYGVSTTGNIKALLMSLSSVLMGEQLPKEIIVRSEGQFPETSEFYLEQLGELARLKEVEFSITTAKSKGIRHARDWLIDRCRTPFLWMGDDDVLYAPYCLSELRAAAQSIPNETLGYINGNKPDVNNRRGYEDFTVEPIDSATVKPNSGYNAFFKGEGVTVPCHTCDTGNLLLRVTNIRARGVVFQQFDKAFNSSGDDTLFALLCQKAGLSGHFTTRADSYHLEKPKARFNEFTARKNMLLRECELLDLPTDALGSMLPWLK